MITKRGIYHNLDYSKYTVSNGEAVLFFSSMFYLEKFLEEYKENRKKTRRRISKVFDISNMNLDLLTDFHLYKSIEKRGFKINIKGCDSTWQETLRFALVNVIKESTKDYERIHYPK